MSQKKKITSLHSVEDRHDGGSPASVETKPAPAGSRRQAREAALQVLYLSDTCRRSPSDVPSTVWAEEPLTPKTRAFAEHIVAGTLEHQREIDPLLQRYTENWELHRMAAIDRCILRMAAFELLKDLDTPVNVIINEAVEIAKRYSTAESSKFVNGILDKVKLERKSNHV